MKKYYNLYMKDTKQVFGNMELVPLMEFESHKDLITFLKVNYNVDTNKKVVSYAIKTGGFIKDLFAVYVDIEEV